jgi:hypothetical protein
LAAFRRREKTHSGAAAHLGRSDLPHNHLHRIGSVAELNGFLSVGDETINSVDDEAAMAERGHRLSPQVKLAAQWQRTSQSPSWLRR